MWVTAVGGLLVAPVHFGLAEIRWCRRRCRPAGSAPSGAISARRRGCREPSCCLPRADKAFPKAVCAAAGVWRRSALSAVRRSPFSDKARVFNALFMQIPGAFFSWCYRRRLLSPCSVSHTVFSRSDLDTTDFHGVLGSPKHSPEPCWALPCLSAPSFVRRHRLLLCVYAALSRAM